MPSHFKRPPKILQYPEELKNTLKEFYNRHREITLINDLEKSEPLYQKMLPMLWPGQQVSVLGMDLVLEGTRIGDLLLFAEGKHRYTESHARLMSLLNEPFAEAISKILQHQEILDLRDRLVEENRFLHNQLREISGDTIIGADGGLKTIMETIRQIAPLNSPILLMGETGVGKEVIANAIHSGSKRSKGPFIKVNCGAIPETLIDSELFGHEKGAFTGANFRRIGKFEEANGGTLFLDELAEMEISLQAKLLRAIQEREIVRIGSNKPVSFDCRIIVATNKNLMESVKDGTFRQDLYYRLYGLPIEIPPLRERDNDIILLAKKFISDFCAENKLAVKTLTQSAVNKLKAYSFPGNVRELKSVSELAVVLTDGEEITADQIMTGGNDIIGELHDDNLTLREYNLRIVRNYMKMYDNNTKTVAEKLDIGIATVYRMLKEDKE
ncbi:MAG TPA: regulator [Bacteroidales bacterium]|nr:regulator [Bacteroidales bacterium]